MKIAPHHILQFLFFFSPFFHPIYSATNSTDYYNQCAPSTCGNSILKFPFGKSPLCSGIDTTITCENSSVYFTVGAHTKFKLLQNLTNKVYANKLVRIVDTSLFGCGTISSFTGLSPNSGQAQNWIMTDTFHSTSDYRGGIFLNCTKEPDRDTLGKMIKSPCLECGETSNFCFFYDGFLDHVDYCSLCRVNIPVTIYSNLGKVRNLRRVLQEGYEISWNEDCNSCMENDVGRCGYLNQERKASIQLNCFCSDGVHKHNCTDGEPIILNAVGMNFPRKPHNKRIGLILGIGLTGGAAFILLCASYISYKRRHKKHSHFRSTDDHELKRYFERDNGTTPASIETFLHNYTLEKPTRFSYKQLKKYTNNFSQKIGQGGFGSVFKGQLPNGFIIAVKILDETTNQIETQFLNEVFTIGCIHHNHLVRLLGYCFDHSRIALIYEYLVNGSLEKYILQKKHMNKSQSKNTTPQDVPGIMTLTWSQLFDIAIGTAKGLAYLHEECRNRILHCDIKPHNILLDDKFQPKVSDFGLAMALNKDNSHISMTHGTGTPGYAPPEMWYEKFGPVTDKSDVYSFGMVVLEMAGKRRNFEVDVSKTSEMYFPKWVFSHHVQNAYGDGGGSKWHECQGKEEEEIAMKLEMVGLWCIQFEPLRRPSMRKVVDMLEGTVAIEIPSAPFDANMSMYGYGREVEIAPELNTLSFSKNT